MGNAFLKVAYSLCPNPPNLAKHVIVVKNVLFFKIKKEGKIKSKAENVLKTEENSNYD